MHRRQFDQPHPVLEPARHLPGDLAGQPGLTRTPGPVTVSSRYRSSRPTSSRSGPARPMKIVSTTGKLCIPPAAVTGTVHLERVLVTSPSRGQNVATYDDPLVQIGVQLDGHWSIAELIGPGRVQPHHRLMPIDSFLGYVIAEPTGAGLADPGLRPRSQSRQWLRGGAG